MRKPQTWAAVSAGLAVGIGLFTAGPASAEPATAATTKAAQPQDANSCFGSTGSDAWVGHPTTGYTHGAARFQSRDELLYVEDYLSNGRRIVVRFSWCESGAYVPYQNRDSGMDQGDVDSNMYDYNFAEGRKIRFKVCEERSRTDETPASCGATVYGHA
ncbi:MAG TPA: hypothetical protein VIP77_18490 [Jiangellaceae bacterium]